MFDGPRLICPAGQSEPVLLEQDGSLAITSPRPRWLKLFAMELESRWGLPLLQQLTDDCPLGLETLGLEVWLLVRRSQQAPVETPAELLF